MICLLLFSFLASAIAAPNYFYPNHGPHYGPSPFSDHRHMRFHSNDVALNFVENIFDAETFCQQLSNAIRESAVEHFIVIAASQQGVEGNLYKITIPLAGFEEKDIVVKALEGQLMIIAHHQNPEGSQNDYVDLRHLPKILVMNGTWVYDKSGLTITFPLKEGVTTAEPTTGTAAEVTTEPSNVDREEIEENQDNGVNENADVGRSRCDVDTKMLNSRFPSKDTVEANIYDVDLKDDVEFFPVRY